MKLLISMFIIFFNVTFLYAAGSKAPRASLVSTSLVQEGYANSLQNYVGTLYYDRNSDLASQSSGIVKKLFVEEGQKVKKSQVLLELESSVLQANIKAKKAVINSFLAKQKKQQKDLQRAKALLDKKSISQSSYDNTYYSLEALNAEIESHKAELLSMNIDLDKKIIKAPYDSVVVKRDVDLGEWVSVGSSVFNIVDLKTIEARVNIPSKLLDKLHKEQTLMANIEGEDLQVSIKTIIPLADKASRTFPLKLSFSTQKNLIEGMRIDVKVPTLKQEKVLLVNRDAVIKRFGKFVVFSIVDAKAMMLPVKVINYTQNKAAISAQGLKAGMKVITKGNERIFPNMPVAEKAQ